MIVRMDKEQQRSARRELLGDVVYIISHESLKKMQQQGHTSLTPVELFLSARHFCNTLLQLPDALEGLDDEMEDLEEEAEGPNDAMLILTLAAAQMQALSKRRVGIDFHSIIFRIFEHLDDHELLLPLIEQMARKEDARWMEGKKSDLLNYEMHQIELEGGSSEEIRALFMELITYCKETDPEGIRGTILFLNRYNLEHNHAYDKELMALYKVMGEKQQGGVTVNGDFVQDKHVGYEVQNVEPGGVGVINENKKSL